MNAVVATTRGPWAALAAAQATLPGSPDWQAWRHGLLERLTAEGLPTPRADAWKYTNLRLLERRTLAPRPPAPLAVDALASLPAIEGPRLVFIDGRYSAALSTAVLPAGIEFTQLATLYAKNPPADFSARLATAEGGVDERVRQLNAALGADGAWLRCAPGVRLPTPLSVVNVATGGGAYPRLWLDVGAGASLTLVEFHLGHGDAESVTAACADVKLEAGAALEHLSVQLASRTAVLLDDVAVGLAREARYSHRLLALGAQLARLDLRVELTGDASAADLAGLVLAGDQRQLDVRTLVTHAGRRTVSTQLYRGISSGRGRGSYDGKVLVQVGAAGSDSRQSCRGLLLSRDAAFDARPQLEINTDDVKCSHGAATGALDEQMLFYLLSRGLDRATARALLSFAFAEDVIAQLTLPALRRYAEERLLGSLPAAELIREFVA